MENLYVYVLIILVIGVSWKMYCEMDYFQLKCILADENGETYCVRERGAIKTEKAANLLAGCVEKCKKLIGYLNENNGSDVRVVRLVKRFNPKRVSETLPTSTLTAYSENKGEKLAICLNKKKSEKAGLIDENTLFFVAMHELAHISSDTIGHKQEFWKNFKFLLVHAKKAGLYEPVDYKNSNQEFCGMSITDNPYYDV